MTAKDAHGTWRRLYEIAEQVRRLAPWQWLDETHIFGVEDPRTGKVGYISVQGAYDDEAGVFLYLDEEGWTAYWALMEFIATAGTIPEEMAFSIPMLAVTWGRKEELTEQELQLLEELNLTPAEEMAWPLFRSFLPGWSPWYLTEQEAEFLAMALQQLLVLAPMLRDNQGDLLLSRLSEGHVLVRTSKNLSSPENWVSEWRPIPQERTTPYHIRIPGQTLDEYRQMLPNREEIQLDFFMLPTAIEEEPGKRPYIPYVLLVVDKDKEELLDARIFNAREGVRAMFERIPGEVLKVLREHQVRPTRLHVRTERLDALMRRLAQELTMEVKRTSTLRPLDRFRILLLERVVHAGYPEENDVNHWKAEPSAHSRDGGAT